MVAANEGAPRQPSLRVSAARDLMLRTQFGVGAGGCGRGGKKFTQEQVAEATARLVRTKPPPKEQESTAARTVLSKPVLAASVDRLYAQAVETRTKAEKARNQKFMPPLKGRVVLTTEQIESGVSRLFSSSVRNRAQAAEALRAKHHGAQGTGRVLDAAGMQQNVERLYTKPLKDRREAAERLEGKYICGTLRPRSVRTSSEWVETMERLHVTRAPPA